MENDNTDPLPALAGFPVMPAEPSPSVAPMPIAQQPALPMEQQDTTMMDAAVRLRQPLRVGHLAEYYSLLRYLSRPQQPPRR